MLIGWLRNRSPMFTQPLKKGNNKKKEVHLWIKLRGKWKGLSKGFWFIGLIEKFSSDEQYLRNKFSWAWDVEFSNGDDRFKG